MRKKILLATAAVVAGAVVAALGLLWKLERDYQAWWRQSDGAMQAHARGHAAHGDARSLLGAAFVWPGDDASDADPGAALRPPQQARTWLDAARRQAPTDPLVVWIDARDCAMAQQRACDRHAAAATLVRVDPGNAAAHLEALEAAHGRHDAAAARRHLRDAASAPRHVPYERALLDLMDAAGADVALPSMPAGMAKALGLAFRLERPATASDFGVSHWSQLWLARTLATLPSGLTHQCTPAGMAGNASLERDCRVVLARMAHADDASSISVLIGLQGMVRLTADEPAGARWREELRRHYWLWDHAVQALAVGFPGSAMGAGGYSRFWIREGEVAAWREALRRAGMPPEPPPGWLPKARVARALIQTGRDPVVRG